jgi:endonuclease G
MLCRKAYIVAHDDQRLTYDWVAWALTPEHAMGCLARKNQFAADPDLPKDHRSTPADYLKSGYDQGHGFPDMDGTWDAEVQTQSFFMSNMAVQAGSLNRFGWEQLESDTRAWAVSGLGPMVIYDIPIWGASPNTIGIHHVAVPDAFGKVVYSPVKHQAVSVIMPNGPVAKSEVPMYLVSVSDVERAAGLSIPLPADTDKAHVVTLWPSDLSGYARAKKAACAVKH